MTDRVYNFTVLANANVTHVHVHDGRLYFIVTTWVRQTQLLLLHQIDDHLLFYSFRNVNVT